MTVEPPSARQPATNLPEGLSATEIKKRKDYWAMRRGRAQALATEDNLYVASEVEAWARRASQAIIMRVQEVPQQLAERLANQPAEQVRVQLSAWAERFLGEIADAFEAIHA